MFKTCINSSTSSFRVGLSAGTGLGVSSALVQNSGNDAANQDPANNNPPAAVPAHPIQPHPPQPGGAPPPPPPIPPDPDMDIVDEDMDSDSDYDPMVEPPFDQLPDPSAEGRHPIVDHVLHQDLSDPRPEVHVDDITEPRSNRGSSSKGSQDGSKSGSGSDPQPGPSRASSDRSESKCQCSTNREKTDKSSTGSGNSKRHETPSRASPNCEDCPNLPNRGRLKHTPPPSSEDASPTRRSKRLRLSRGTPPSASPSNTEPSSSSGASNNGGKYTGKGKSLRGRKKGLVKRSRASTNLLETKEERAECKKEKKEESEEEEEVKNKNQSCQAVSEEIRETTKKAKEKDEAARKGTVRGASARKPEEEDAAVQVT